MTSPTMLTAPPLARAGAGVPARACLAALALCVVLLAGCAGFQPGRVQPGQSEAQLLSLLGPPTGRYAMRAGAQRLEYARGPMGTQTWMVDLDAQGQVTAVDQVLTPPYFELVRDGMPVAELLRLLGRPGFRQGEARQREIWSWRYDNPFCLWARVSIDAQGRVVDGLVQATEPRCENDS